MFHFLSRKLNRWERENLITGDQMTRIMAYERDRSQVQLVRGLTRVGLFAIFLGVVSLVAANWPGIPATGKIAGHFIVNLALALYMLSIDGMKKPLLRDACAVLLSGLFLTFIALIGQTYQLHGDLHTTLLFWLAICTPFLWAYGRTHGVIVPWLAVAMTALYLNLGHYLEDMENRLLLVGSLISFYLAPVLLLVARSSFLQRHRPRFIRAFSDLGLYLPAIFANIAICLFYDGTRNVEYQTIQIAAMAFGLFAMFILFHPGPEKEIHKSTQWFYLLVSGMVMMLPFVLPELSSDLVSAILFVAYWVFLAWAGARIQSNMLVDIAIKLVILRLFIIYVEVFGGMMATGISLIVSGVILLVILRNLNKIVAAGRRVLNYDVL